MAVQMQLKKVTYSLNKRVMTFIEFSAEMGQLHRAVEVLIG